MDKKESQQNSQNSNNNLKQSRKTKHSLTKEKGKKKKDNHKIHYKP
jgi:hypothetical protein